MSGKEKDIIVVIETTCGTLVEAKQIAKGLLEQQTVACCHLIPICSLYRWKGMVDESEEVVVRCKTLRKKVREVVEYIQKHHLYEVPQIVVTESEVLNASYYEWLKDSIEEKKG